MKKQDLKQHGFIEVPRKNEIILAFILPIAGLIMAYYLLPTIFLLLILAPTRFLLFLTAFAFLFVEILIIVYSANVLQRSISIKHLLKANEKLIFLSNDGYFGAFDPNETSLITLKIFKKAMKSEIKAIGKFVPEHNQLLK